MSDIEKRDFKFDMIEKGATSNMDGSVNIPACLGCTTDHYCRSVRINNKLFSLSPSQQRKVDLFCENAQSVISHPFFSLDLFALFKEYVTNRHGHTNTKMTQYRSEDFQKLLGHPRWMITTRDQRSTDIISFALVDQHEKNFSLEYLAYDVRQMKKSPGLSTILMTAQALKQSYPDGYLYLGSWSPGSPKLGYKNQFLGLEIRGQDGWHPLPRNSGPEAAPQPPSPSSFL